MVAAGERLVPDVPDPHRLFAGYGLAAATMLAAAVIGRVYGVDAERHSLEELTLHVRESPLSK